MSHALKTGRPKTSSVQSKTESSALPEQVLRPKRVNSSLSDTLALAQRIPLRGKALQAHDVLHLQRTIGNRATSRVLQRLAASVQAKLTVGEAGDVYEREADAAADRIAAGESVQRISRLLAGGVTDGPQRQYETEEKEEVQAAPVQRKCPACEEEAQRQLAAQDEEPVQAKSGGGEGLDSVGAERAMARSGSGNPLAPDLQSSMERSFGTDFSGVRVHTGPAAQDANLAVKARAFTHGSDIYLGRGESAGDTRLIAHELTHVVQQEGAPLRIQGFFDDLFDWSEDEASEESAEEEPDWEDNSGSDDYGDTGGDEYGGTGGDYEEEASEDEDEYDYGGTGGGYGHEENEGGGWEHEAEGDEDHIYDPYTDEWADDTYAPDSGIGGYDDDELQDELDWVTDELNYETDPERVEELLGYQEYLEEEEYVRDAVDNGNRDFSSFDDGQLDDELERIEEQLSTASDSESEETLLEYQELLEEEEYGRALEDEESEDVAEFYTNEDYFAESHLTFFMDLGLPALEAFLTEDTIGDLSEDDIRGSISILEKHLANAAYIVEDLESGDPLIFNLKTVPAANLTLFKKALAVEIVEEIHLEPLPGPPPRVELHGPYSDSVIAEELYGDASVPVEHDDRDHSIVHVSYALLRAEWKDRFEPYESEIAEECPGDVELFYEVERFRSREHDLNPGDDYAARDHLEDLVFWCGYEDLDGFEDYVSGIVGKFREGAVEYAKEHLSKYEEFLTGEGDKYEHPAWIDALWDDMTSMRKIGAEINEIEGEIESDLAGYEFDPSQDSDPRPPALQEGGELDKAVGRFEAEKNKVARSHPLLADCDFPYGTLASSQKSELLPVIHKYIEDKQGSIAVALDRLEGEPDVVFELDLLMDSAKRLQGLSEESLGSILVQRQIDTIKAGEEFVNTALTIVQIVAAAITLAAGPLGWGVAVGSVAAGVGFAAGLAELGITWEEYQQDEIFHQVKLLSENSSFGWVMLAMVGVVLDVGDVAKVAVSIGAKATLYRKAHKSARSVIDSGAASKFNDTGDLAEFDKSLRGLKEGGKIADDAYQALLRAAKEENREYVESFVGSVSDETIDLLSRNPEYLRTLGESPLARRFLKHCASPCFPEYMTFEQVEYLQEILANFSKRGLDFSDVNVKPGRLLADIEQSSSGDIWGLLAELDEGLRLRSGYIGDLWTRYGEILAETPYLEARLTKVRNALKEAAESGDPAKIAKAEKQADALRVELEQADRLRRGLKAGSDEEFEKEIEEAFDVLEKGKGEIAGGRSLPSAVPPEAPDLRTIEGKVEAIRSYLKKKDIKGLHPSPYGTKVGTLLAKRLRMMSLPEGWTRLVDEPLRKLPNMPAKMRDMLDTTVEDYLRARPYLEEWLGKIPSKTKKAKIGDLRPDLLLIADDGEALISDLTSELWGSHLAKTQVYSQIITDSGVAGKVVVSEVYWRNLSLWAIDKLPPEKLWKSLPKDLREEIVERVRKEEAMKHASEAG